MSRSASLISALILGLAVAVPALPAQSVESPTGQAVELYGIDAPRGTGEKLRELGLDVIRSEAGSGSERVELTATRSDLDVVENLGLEAEPVRDPQGRTQAVAARAQAASGYQVWRSYSEPGGIADQLAEIAQRNPDLVELVSIGRSVQGKEILAAKVTAGARSLPDGSRPAVLYSATQHAREWISTEVDMRLLKRVVGDRQAFAELLNSTELWFVPVMNPDGYDFTFTEGNRLWRKNLRDNDGDGKITNADGVDLNRNFATNFGYDDEGSSRPPGSQRYRGTGPNSEPETRAMDGLLSRIKFKFQINYHSYAGMLLRPARWQIATKTADDPVYSALAGDYANPAVPGFDPDASTDTNNGETVDHAHGAYGTIAWTAELEEGCDGCGFVFPDDDRLVQEEFEKNLPFALDLAKSAPDPANPVSHLGNEVPDFVVDGFDVSYGTDQEVQVDAKRELGPVQLHYEINNGLDISVPTEEWAGGERYGKGYDTYFHRMRGKVTGAKPGDEVTVWFTAQSGRSEEFTYTVADDIGGDVLVLAAEDVTGTDPDQQGDTAKYAGDYVAALERAGYSADVYDMDARGRKAPHPLGVLGHYKAVIWETGDDVVPRDKGQQPGTISRAGVRTELAVRDYLNEGGKLLHTGKNPSYAQNNDGAFTYQPHPELGECVAPDEPQCIPVFNDFQQYYLGAYLFFDNGGTDPGTAKPYALAGRGGGFDGFAATLRPSHTAAYLATSQFLPPEQFPQFAASAQLGWDGPGPTDPHSGTSQVYSGPTDGAWERLTRTIDLTGKSSGELSFWVSMKTEADFDYFAVEARTVGQDDWTTLPDKGGHTVQSTGGSCPGGWRSIHPFVQHYQGANCEPTGSSGAWHAATGDSGGWQEWKLDLSAYAGKQVEISLSSIGDDGIPVAGVFLDDVRVTLDGATAAETSFEDGLGGWTIGGPPAGSPPMVNNWERLDRGSTAGAGITTEDTVYIGFGAESLTTPQMRADLVGRSMAHLLGGTQRQWPN
ncbi:M14 family metallopeptidase [Saccharopolyspora shandongensis]|uniref:M14 family metallopeptidase n=1 Tax=Saccharopolyspora shandongensis TaxID=418495 RepID=UPI0033C29337